MPRRTLIVGCGYAGLPLALRLQAGGDEVTGWVRTAESAAAVSATGLARVFVGNVAEPSAWQELAGHTPAFDVVAHAAATGGGGVEAYRSVFLEGVRQMNRHQRQASRLFVSSTSVYGQTDGSWVDETSVTEPAAETSRVLVEAEREAATAGATVIRSAGIYGPGRTRLLEKLRRGEAALDGDGSRWQNQIHRDDLISGMVHLLEHGTAGDIYNAADDEPVTQLDYYAWCARALGQPMPKSEAPNPHRKRGLTNKRVSNRKLRSTGWAPILATFREGLAPEIG